MKIHKRCRACATWYIVPVYSRRKNSKFCSLSCTTTHRNNTNNPTKDPTVRKKISDSAKKRDHGHLRTPEAIDKQRKTISGDKHWNWQGGKTDESRRLRNSREYKRWRGAVFSRDDYTCQICKERGCYIEADHIKPWAHFADLRFELSNGRTLCAECHRNTDTFGVKSQ